ncbi:MAG TPA: hypothetical protein VGE21_04300 [Flavobacteriales bacterium]
MKTLSALSPKAIEAHFGQVVLADPRTLRLWYLQEEVRDAAEATVRTIERRRTLLKEHAKQRAGKG